MTTEADTFTRNCPDISEGDAVQAAKDGRIIQSFNAHPVSERDGTYQALAVKLKFSNGTTETVLIGRYSALVLGMLFSQLEANKWTELVTLQPGATPQ